MGAITAPITATLRAGSAITEGVSSTATMIGNIGKVTVANSVYSRFRAPRHINTRNVVQPYNEELAMVS